MRTNTAEGLNERGESWRIDARCLGKDGYLFFSSDEDEIARAKAICANCPVKLPCFDFARANNAHGIWGGLIFTDGKVKQKRGRPSKKEEGKKRPNTDQKPSQKRPVKDPVEQVRQKTVITKVPTDFRLLLNKPVEWMSRAELGRAFDVKVWRHLPTEKFDAMIEALGALGLPVPPR